MGRLFGVAALVIASFGLGGCAPRGVSVQSDAAYADAATNLRRPPPDRARIYVFTGYSVGGYPVAYRRPHGISADIFINGVKIGTVNPKEVMVFEVKPDVYMMWWQYHQKENLVFGDWKKQERSLNGGQVLFLTADSDEWNPALNVLSGAQFVENGRLNPKLNLTVTRPASCPPTICVQ